jgi:micrococcal nuclease
VLALGLLLAGCQEDVATTAPVRHAAEQVPVARSTPAQPVQAPVAVRRDVVAPALLRAARGGDGDSWKDTRGVEYRLGLVNTPELSECYGRTASAKRKQLTAAGFRARAYAVDDFDRRVAVVTLADGRNLNVWLARHGYANDKYLATYRRENPALAAQLDKAFAAARRERAGLWRTCVAAAPVQGIVAPPATSTKPAGSCDPSYPDVCIPPPLPDLDCGDISHRRFRVLAPDPHRFDADHDGLGCESG